jgi:hypothetical protein
MDDLELTRRFRRPQPNPVVQLGDAALDFARAIARLCRDGYEQRIALDRLEESLMWATAAAAGILGCGPDCPTHGDPEVSRGC